MRPSGLGQTDESPKFMISDDVCPFPTISDDLSGDFSDDLWRSLWLFVNSSDL